MFQCKDLVSLNSMSKAKLIAGAGGLEKGIRWSYKAENMNFEQWVRGQELLIISSPITQRKNFNLYATIKKAIELKMSCALLLVGENYVSEIDETVIHMADKSDFPLFTISWDVPLLDFFEELGHTIAYLDEKKNMQDSFLAEIIFGSGVNEEKVRRKCIEMGMDENSLEQVFVMCPNLSASKDIVYYVQSLQSIFQKEKYPAIVLNYGERIIGFIQDSSKCREQIVKCFKEFEDLVKKNQEEFCFTLCIGENCLNITDLQKSFQEVSGVMSFLEKLHKTNEVVFFDQIGYYRMLMQYENKEPMRKFVENVLHELLEYDNKNHTQLIDTLWAYYENGCNMQKTAEVVFSHKNTIKYRLQRVEEITGRDLSNQFQSMELYNALIMYFYLK